ncbi:sulfatase [Chloroflexi bacterium TSY]|nr:sulfatase [Chloroflexi bacterium TSY]
MNQQDRPNILLIVADDHAPAAFSTYGSQINQTPNLDRLANEGLRLDHCYCTNSICTPARASILTGKYSHGTGIKTLNDTIDQTRETTLGMLLHDAGYQTAFIGKWHLGHGGVSDPVGFDYWNVLPIQGAYRDPEMIEMGERKVFPGYVTDVLMDHALSWLQDRREDQPFFLVCANKAPHDPFIPNPKHLGLYADEDIPEPSTFHDDYNNRSAAAAMTTEQVAIMHKKNHTPETPPEGLTPNEQKQWNYQSFIKGYLRCVASVDENVGRMLDYLDEVGLAENTIVIYTSDHGFFLGDHGWYDKRFMYEESIRIPFLMRYPPKVAPGTVSNQLAINVDFAPTLLEYAKLPVPDEMQGQSLRPIAEGEKPSNWRTSFYYRYWMHLAHFNIPAHYGVRTERYKLIYYYGEALGSAGAIEQSTEPEWELFDLETDPMEMMNVYADPAYAGIVQDLKNELARLRQELGDDS